MLGDEALDLETLAAEAPARSGGERAPLGLGDFFFDPDDPLHPDRDDDEDDDDDRR